MFKHFQVLILKTEWKHVSIEGCVSKNYFL